MCPLYTKTFGGKIWKKLHSVSPGNFLDEHFNGVPHWIFSAKNILHIPSWTQINENIWSDALKNLLNICLCSR